MGHAADAGEEHRGHGGYMGSGKAASARREFSARAIEAEVAREVFGPRPGDPAGSAQARRYREATLLCADVANLPGLAASTRAEVLVAVLDELFLLFDRAAERQGMARVPVRGQACAAVAGVPDPRLDHARAAADMALELAGAAHGIAPPGGAPVSLRIGLHTGPLLAALEPGGAVRELWGEAAGVAERMASGGLPGLVQVSGATAARLFPGYWLSWRRGGGDPSEEAWILTGRRPV